MDFAARVGDACCQVAASVSETVDNGAHMLLERAARLLNELGSRIDDLSGFASAQVVEQTPAPTWVEKHRKTAAIVAIGTLGVLGWRLWCPRPHKRVCGSRAPDGGRQDVVLILGCPSEPLVRLIAGELNMRSFIVYVTAFNSHDEEVIKDEGSPDIRALRMNPMSPASVQEAFEQMDLILKTRVTTMPGGAPYYLQLAAVLVIPDLQYPQGPSETLSQASIEHVIASKLITPLYFVQGGLVDLVRKYSSRVILLSPNIIGNLCPAFHLMESMSAAALSKFALTLHRELKPQAIPIVHVKLGSFDTGHEVSDQQRQITNKMRGDILEWPEKTRHIYSGSYLDSSYLEMNRTNGSNLEQLHTAIARLITIPRPPRVQYVGRYSYAYEWLENHLPERLMTLLLAS